MYYNRGFYEEHKKIIDDVAKDLLDLYKEAEIQKNESLLKKMSKQQQEQFMEMINQFPKIIEGKTIYTIFQNGYDPRAGATFVVYAPIPKLPQTELEKFLLEHFGKFYLTKERDCKKSNYRVYDKNSLDYNFGEKEYKVDLNIIFADEKVLENLYVQDLEKYNKYLSKAPKDIVY